MSILKYKLARFIVFMLCWIGLSQLMTRFNQPKFHTPTEFFVICASNSLGNDKPLALYTITEYQANPQAFHLCQNPTEQASDNGIFRMTLTQRPDQSYLLTTYNDSLGDPLEYHYRIDDGKVVPIGWRHGGMIRDMMSYFYGLIISMVGYSLIKRWCLKRATQPHTVQLN